MAEWAKIDKTRADIKRLVQLRHADPHSMLSSHPSTTGVTVRPFRLGARAMAVTADGTSTLIIDSARTSVRLAA